MWRATRLWASLSGPNQINTDSIAILNQPLAMEIDKDDQVYISGAYVSHQYFSVRGNRWHTRTGKRCVGEGIYEIRASNPRSTYLWSDGSIDSVYHLRYTDSTLVKLVCQVTNACGVQVIDSLVVQFLPPYAYLGADTVLCKWDTLFLDMSEIECVYHCSYVISMDS